jgi:hypothetical protein
MVEFDTFKAKLMEEWDWAFLEMLGECSDTTTDDERRAAGRALFAKLRDSTKVQMRGHYSEPFYARGVQFEIADGGKHGWHPDFQQLLESLVSEGT